MRHSCGDADDEGQPELVRDRRSRIELAPSAEPLVSGSALFCHLTQSRYGLRSGGSLAAE
jgi:hypothetical protein